MTDPRIEMIDAAIDGAIPKRLVPHPSQVGFRSLVESACPILQKIALLFD
ncbi:MAG: hypothetical protein ACAF42_04735 [Limnothrix sp. BL-A-16]